MESCSQQRGKQTDLNAQVLLPGGQIQVMVERRNRSTCAEPCENCQATGIEKLESSASFCLRYHTQQFLLILETSFCLSPPCLYLLSLAQRNTNRHCYKAVS